MLVVHQTAQTRQSVSRCSVLVSIELCWLCQLLSTTAVCNCISRDTTCRCCWTSTSSLFRARGCVITHWLMKCRFVPPPPRLPLPFNWQQNANYSLLVASNAVPYLTNGGTYFAGVLRFRLTYGSGCEIRRLDLDLEPIPHLELPRFKVCTARQLHCVVGTVSCGMCPKASNSKNCYRRRRRRWSHRCVRIGSVGVRRLVLLAVCGSLFRVWPHSYLGQMRE